MQTFIEWLSWLHLIETYYSFDAGQYNALFNGELEKLIRTVSAPEHRAALERMKGFNWVGYIARCVWNAGYHDQRQVQERTHDIVVKLVMGTLFRAFDERTSGPMDLRFKRSVANAVKNIVEKEKNRRRFIPTVSIGQEFQPGAIAAADLPGRPSSDQDERVIENFRQLLSKRLGDLAVAIFDLRMEGGETKSLVGSSSLGFPSPYGIKRTVQEIKALARQYAASLGDFTLLQRIDQAMQDEEATAEKRKATARQRQQVGV
jgi:hypothetical protein